MSEDFILTLDNIVKEYPGVKALDGVSLNLRRGEILGLIGENGAGKSTLVKTISGAISPTSGKIIIDGEEFKSMTPQSAVDNGIAIIYQEFNNVQELSVAENMFLGHPIRKGIVIDRDAMNKKASEIFEQLGVNIDPDMTMKHLTVGYQQMVEIGKALLQDAKILIMDEPSAPLTNNEINNMFRVVELLRDRGVSIIYISHRLEEIFYLSQRIVVLRDGQYVGTLETAESNVDQLIQMMVGREMTREYPSRDPNLIEDEIVLQLDNVTGNGVKDISFSLRKGEILGLGGLVGAGRTEVAELLFGVKPIDEGKIVFKGKPLEFSSPRQAIDSGVALVTEDRKRYGLLLHMDIEKNTSMPIYQRISRLGKINAATEEGTAAKYFDSLRIKAPSVKELTKNLSGGNQQKVVIAKWLGANAELIIFDEPTRGIDVGAKQEIYYLINELIEEGKSIILISSEIEELFGMSDRILVLAEGEIRGELEKDAFNADVFMTMASNIKDRGHKNE